MMSDAISHAVLPGIVFGFFFTGTLNSPILLLGAASMGLFATLLIAFLQKQARVQSDAAIGVTFTWLFALGIILVSLYTKRVDLDVNCVLHGELLYVALDPWITEGGINLGPRVLYVLGGVLLFNVLFVVINYRKLFLTTFDPGYAESIGISVSLWHYLLMGATSLTTVAAFDSVGAILVIALLVVPPATAYLLTKDLTTMLWLSVILGIIISVLGYFLADWIDASPSGSISTVAGILFTAAFIIQYKKHPHSPLASPSP